MNRASRLAPRVGWSLLLMLAGAATADAYNRQYAVAYSTTWWNTDSNLNDYASGNPVANHINSSRATPPGPYTWYYALGFQVPLTHLTIHYWRSNDDGTGTVSSKDGEDCTNFVSQVLLAGGIQFTGPTTGQGGTLKEVRRLDAALRKSNTVVSQPAQTAGDLPPNLQIGDVIEFGGRHMTVVVSTSPSLQVSYHSYDNIGVTPAAIINSSPLMRPAVAFQITQDQLTIPQNQTPPSMSIFDMTGTLLGATAINPDSSPSGVTIPAISGTPATAVVSDAVGIQSFIVTKDAPLIDGIEDVLNGVGSEVFRDDTFYPSGHTYTLPTLTDGVYFVEAFDADGNASVSGFTIDRPPRVRLGTVKVTQNPVGAFPAQFGISGDASDDVALRSIRLFRESAWNATDKSPLAYDSLAPLQSLPPNPAQTFQGMQSSSAFFFGGLSPVQRPDGSWEGYVIVAKDMAGNLDLAPVDVGLTEIAGPRSVRTDCISQMDNLVDHGVRALVPSKVGSQFVGVSTFSGLVDLPDHGPSELIATYIKNVIAKTVLSSYFLSDAFVYGPGDPAAVSLNANSAANPHNPYLDIPTLPRNSLQPVAAQDVLGGDSPRVQVIDKTPAQPQTQFPAATGINSLTFDATFEFVDVRSPGDGMNPPYSFAPFNVQTVSLSLSPSGHRVNIDFPNGVRAPGTATAGLVAQNLDPTCGVFSASKPGSIVAMNVSVDPVFNGKARVTLPLDPALPPADKPYAAMWVYTTLGPENVTESVNPAGDTVSGLTDTFGTMALVMSRTPDKTPPVSALVFPSTTPHDAQGLPVVGPNALLPLSADDAAGSGVLATEYRTGPTEYRLAGQPLISSSSVRAVSYRSWDRDGNLEVTRTAQVHVDADPPAIAALTSSGVFTQGLSSVTVSWTLNDNLDPLPTAQALLVQVSTSGVPIAGSTPVPVTVGQVVPASDLNAGGWVLVVTAGDFVANASSSTSGIFTVIPADSLPPRTQLTLGTPSVPGNPAFVGPSTVITLSAEDDRAAVNDKAGVGVASITYAVDGATTVVPSPSASFALAQEGAHTLAFFAADRAGHVEAVRAASITVDATPPAVTALQPADGALTSDNSPRLAATAGDFLSGVSTGANILTLDGRPLAPRVAAVPGGAFGAWEAAPPLPEPLASHRMAAVGNVVVAVGGRNAAGDSLHNIATAVLSSSGALSAWRNFPNVLEPAPLNAAVAVSGSRFYVLAGNNGGQTRIHRFSVDANGGLHYEGSVDGIPVQSGEPESSVIIGSPRRLFYVVPEQGRAFSAPLDDAGNLSINWVEGASFTARSQAAMAQWGGRLYIVGGGGVNTWNQVLASVGAEDGKIDSWERAADLPEGRLGGKLTVLDGRLVYIAGGVPSGGYSRKVFMAVSSGSTISGWSELPTPFTLDQADFGLAALPNMVLVAGGRGPHTGILSDAVWGMRFIPDGTIRYADLSVPDLPPLPDGPHTLALHGFDRAGNPGSASATFTIDTVPPALAFSVDGAPASTIAFTPTQGPRPAFRFDYSDANGVDAAGVRLILDGADVTAQGSVGPGQTTFTPAAALSAGLHVLTAQAQDLAGNRRRNSITVMVDGTPPQIALSAPAPGAVVGAVVSLAASAADGGAGLSTASLHFALGAGTVAATVQNAPVFPPGTWRPETLLPIAVTGLRMVHWNGFLYLIGGNMINGTSAAVYMSVIGPGGVAGPWTPTTPLPTRQVGMAAVTSKGVLYEVDGIASYPTNKLRYARLDPQTGAVGGWQEGPSMPAVLVGAEGALVTIASDYLYATGGGYPFLSNRVFVCPLLADGTPGPGCWSDIAPLPEDRTSHRMVASSNKLFVIGGTQDYPLTSARDTVYIGDVGPGGQVASWRAGPALPERRLCGAAGVVDGVLVCAGGRSPDGAASDRSDILIAPISPSGDPLAWRYAASLPHSADSMGMAAAGRILYVSGGQTPDGIPIRDHYSASFTDRVTLASAAAAGAAAAEGPLVVSAYAADAAGNAAVSSLTVTVDLTPPQTSLAVLASSRSLAGTILARAGTELRLDATDAVAGVASSFISVDSATAQVVRGTFTLAEGAHDLAFRSADAVGNLESTRTARVKLDGTPPAPAADLVATALSTHSMRFSWSAPGDDGTAGDILDAEVRLSVSTGTAAPSTSTALVVMSSGALARGQALSVVLPGLNAGTSYYAAAFTRDSIGNWSPAAPLVSGRTFFLVNSTDSVASLATPSAAAITVVSSAAAPAPFAVAVATQSLAPLGGRFYELTSGLVFPPGSPAVISFAFDTASAAPAALSIYTFDGVAWSTASIANQRITYLAGTQAVISGEILHTSLYAPMVRDTLPPSTAFSLAGSSVVLEGRLFAGEVSTAVLTAQDSAPRGGTASGVERTVYALDDGAEAAYAAPFALAGGRRRLSFHSVDRSGNVEAAKGAEVFIDTAAPALAVTAMQFASSAAVTLTMADPDCAGARSGLAAASYVLDGATQAVALTPGDAQAAAVVYLASGTHALLLLADDRVGHHGELAVSLVAGDTVPPVTAFSLAGASVSLEGRLFTAGGSSGVLTAQDASPGVARTLYALDGGTETAYSAPFPLSGGRRRVMFRSVDLNGNAEAPKGAEVYVDTAAPVLAAAPEPAAVVVSALDPDVGGARSGLAAASYVLDGDTRTLALTPGDPQAELRIQLGRGMHSLLLRAQDRAGNAAERAYALQVDSTPPALAFAFPRPEEGGLCRLAQGPLQVRGSVFDENISTWSLLQGGFLLSSGTTNAAGTLGTWDASGKSGPFSLALSASDLFANRSSTALAVYAGSPARTLALGGNGLLNKPRGVAAGPNRIYVADTNADLVRVFDAAGSTLAAYGDRKGPLKLRKPQGVAVDGAGNIFVADTGNGRVLKLSPAGALLVQYGGKDVLKKPAAVAVALGRVLVADTKAGSLAVYADAGNLLRVVDLPPAAAADDDPEEPRPMAVAADAAGDFWVADAAGRRVIRYTATLSLAQTLTGFQRPDGVAVSPSGACLAVSDSKADRLRTFDAALGAELAAFGVHGELKDDKPLPAELVLDRPAQLAFTAGGMLLVADRNNDAVQGFGTPGAPVILAWGKTNGSGGGRLLGTGSDGVENTVVTARIGNLEGGTVTAPDRTTVEIQPGSLSEDQDVTVARAAQTGQPAQARENARSALVLAAASAPHEFGPQGLTFSRPARITIPYDPALLAGASPRELRIQYWNAARGTWEALESQVDEDARTVSAGVLHFSLYQVLAPVRSATALADPEAGFALRDIYVFPNPAVRGQKPAFHIAVGKADKVTVRVYDIAGTPVHQATLDGAPAVIDDGSGPHYAYEYAWDGHIASGVYIYSVTAEKAGNAPIKRIGKFAVVR